MCESSKLTTYKQKFWCTGGPRTSWFLVPKSNHEMQGSWIPRTVSSAKPQNRSKKIIKFIFWAFSSWNFDFFPIQIAFPSLHAYQIPCTGNPLLRRISNQDDYFQTEKPSYILIRTVFQRNFKFSDKKVEKNRKKIEKNQQFFFLKAKNTFNFISKSLIAFDLSM